MNESAVSDFFGLIESEPSPETITQPIPKRYFQFINK